MATDWELIRRMMAAVIDACAALEAAGLREDHRSVLLPGAMASVFDALASGWTYPEAVRARIIHARHAASADQPYGPEAARMLVAMAQAAGELVGGQDVDAAGAAVLPMIDWYQDMAAQVAAAIAAAEAERPAVSGV